VSILITPDQAPVRREAACQDLGALLFQADVWAETGIDVKDI
jgi:hypothetical protein